MIARALFLAAAVSACGGGASDTISGPTPLPEPTPTPTPQGPQVEGALFHLYSVDGTPLPARFEPADEAEVRDTHIAGAVIGFGTNGFVNGTEDYVSPLTQVDVAPFAYSARYVQTGDRVLVYAYGPTVAPDTAVLAGTTLTVRAQFFRASMADRYVLTMVYRRQ